VCLWKNKPEFRVGWDKMLTTQILAVQTPVILALAPAVKTPAPARKF
jgi:hypothetical protein